jgi:hypothetical protein
VGFFLKSETMMFFDAIKFWQNVFSPQGFRKIVREILQKKDIQDFIIEMNHEQLYELGEDSKGVSLGEYSPVTIQYKDRKGQVSDRVTLRDTGVFYESFTIKVDDAGFIQNADGYKGGGNDLFKMYGIDILGLNEDNTQRLRDRLIDEIRFYLLNKAA